MHTYKHHIGDFRRDTSHLTDSEELAYRKMLELYYDTEQPLPNDAAWIARRVKSTPDVVSRVLVDFFKPDGEVWRQSRCDREIAEYRKAVRLARSNGKRGGRPRKPAATEPEPARNPAGSCPDTEREPRGKLPVPPFPIPRSPIPNSVLSTPSPSNAHTLSGAGNASLPDGVGERGPEPDPGEVDHVFALLAGTKLRSESKHRRQILREIAGAVVADGMGSDQARRLMAKAKAESRGDPAGLLGTWFKPGVWREKWAEVVSGRVNGIVAGVAAYARSPE